MKQQDKDILSTDERYMRRALELAARGAGFTAPNPLVGAVLVKDGRIIGEGWHQRYGGLHAERNAFLDCDARGEDAAGATLYVTLEPCCHYGKTPPCTEAILARGVRRVVVGITDPNPLVAGKGLAILREAGIAVTQGVLEDDCREMNRIFLRYITTGLPYVTLKYAMTLDGKIASVDGSARWITGEAARADVHRLRHRYSAIMVGAGTVLRDDPLLTCRMEGGRNPLRIVCDSRLRTPLDSQLVKTAGEVPTLLATTAGDPAEGAPTSGIAPGSDTSAGGVPGQSTSAADGADSPDTSGPGGVNGPAAATTEPEAMRGLRGPADATALRAPASGPAAQGSSAGDPTAQSAPVYGAGNESAASCAGLDAPPGGIGGTLQPQAAGGGAPAGDPTEGARAARIAAYEAAGVEVLPLPARDGHVDLRALMAELGRRGIDSVLVEGGGTLAWSLVESGVISSVLAYIAPTLLGGKAAPGPVGGAGFPRPDAGVRLTPPRITRFGDDILLESEVLPCSQGSSKRQAP